MKRLPKPRYLLDINIVLDYLQQRDPWYPLAKALFQAESQERVDLFIAANTIATLHFFIRKKDSPGMRAKLNELARRYPRSHEYIWWGTRPYPTSPGVTINKPCWKVRVETFLKLVGDKDEATMNAYAASTTFAADELLTHPKLGAGVVMRVVDGTKIEVLFREGLRTLVHGRR